ncbi:MAG TPA: FG-GAP-like repeat-containing protein, partial [Pyrinomonadaceae bacterium]|nr:FG-GAP-like repeat-containing protein [Pyrinomonadaceae bacterium]
ESVYRIVLLPDGKVLVGGGFTTVNGSPRGRIARLNADGTLDATFNPLGGANNTVFEIAVQTDGKILIGGSFTSYNGSSRNYLARINSDGSLDGSFSTVSGGTVRAIKIEPNGKIIIGDTITESQFGTSRSRIIRLNADGTLDATFNPGAGLNGLIYTLASQADGKLLAGGNFTIYNNVGKISIVRLLNASAPTRPQFDFDGDRRSDISLFRPSNGNWYILPSQTSAFYGFPFGQAGDQIAPADYDGDGKTDVAVFRDSIPGAGNFAYFYILNSADNSFRAVQFGATGDFPMAGDWDGDGKADLAVYRAASSAGGQSFFYYRPSSQPTVNFNTIPLGTAGDKPLLGDFDGDGRLDPAVFRSSTVTWIILRSSINQITQTNFGLSTDIPVPADYDGDGAANIAVFRPSNGTWYTSTNPQLNYGAIVFGANGDVPVPADYDGDGKADAAVFRPATGAWYLNRTTSGLMGVSFGANGDKPSPSAFIQ